MSSPEQSRGSAREVYDFNGFNDDGTPCIPGVDEAGLQEAARDDAELREVLGNPRPPAEGIRRPTPGSDDPYIPQATHGFSRPIPDHEELGSYSVSADDIIKRMRARMTG